MDCLSFNFIFGLVIILSVPVASHSNIVTLTESITSLVTTINKSFSYWVSRQQRKERHHLLQSMDENRIPKMIVDPPLNVECASEMRCMAELIRGLDALKSQGEMQTQVLLEIRTDLQQIQDVIAPYPPDPPTTPHPCISCDPSLPDQPCDVGCPGPFQPKVSKSHVK